jgi:hypothetical protein
VNEAVSYVVEVVMDELGLTTEEALEVLAASIVEIADGDDRLLESAADQIVRG